MVAGGRKEGREGVTGGKATGDEELETVAETVASTPRAVGSGELAGGTAPSSASMPSGATIHASTLAALHSDEAARANGFARVLGVVCAASLLGLPFQRVPLWLTVLFSAALAVVAAMSLWVWKRTRQPQTYNRRVFRVFGIGCLIASLIAVYYGGVFSSVPVIIALGLSFFAFGDDRSFAIGLSILAVVLYATLGVLTAMGVLPEHGLFPIGESVDAFAKAFAILVTPTALLVTVWQARMSRQATYDAVEKLNLALLEVQQRELLLNEANQNLDQALRAGAGERGSHSGQLAGSYMLAELVGRGAMGEVYAATHKDRGDRAAVKVLSDVGRGNPNYLERFRREADIASKLRGDNLVRVFEVGNIDDVSPFIAMELLSGHDLSWHLRRRRALPLDEVNLVISEVARGVQAAHDAGIVHRDIKPTNLFFDESSTPRWKVLDFGVSRFEGSGETLTQGAVVGTPGYMSPEQAQGRTATSRSDVFSLGAVAYRALTGRPPFSGTDTPQALYTLVYRQPEEPSPLVPDLDGVTASDIDAALALALAKRVDERLPSAASFADALDRACRGELPQKLRDRAAAILNRDPWGLRLRD